MLETRTADHYVDTAVLERQVIRIGDDDINPLGRDEIHAAVFELRRTYVLQAAVDILGTNINDQALVETSGVYIEEQLSIIQR